MKVFGSVFGASILLLLASSTPQKIWADRHDIGHRSANYSRYYDRYAKNYSGYRYDKLYRPYQFYYNDNPPYYYPYYYDNRPIYQHPFPPLYTFFITPYSYNYYPYYYYPDDETIGYYTSKKILSVMVDGNKVRSNSVNRAGGQGTYFSHFEKGRHKIRWTVAWANGDVETYSRKFTVDPDGRGSDIFIDGEHFYQK